MERLFTELTLGVQGAPWIATLAALAWGVVSMVLSPCHLGSIPLIIAYIAGQEVPSIKRAFWIALSFGIGMLLTTAVIGVITAGVGHIMGGLGEIGNYLVAGVMFLVGLYLLGFFGERLTCSVNFAHKFQGVNGGFMLGLVYGLALGPCTFAYMAPILAITFKVGAQNLVYGVFLLLVYGLGQSLVIVLAGTFTKLVEQWLRIHMSSKGVQTFRYVCGVILLVLGVIWIYKA